MQNKGIVKFIAVLLILVCCFYLSFSFVTRHYESKAAAMGEEAGAEYLDSINNEKVYMGIYSLKQCREMEIGLGLDLKGGMNVSPTTRLTQPTRSQWKKPRRKRRPVRTTSSLCS